MIKTCHLCRDAQMIMEDIKRTIGELEQESSLPAVGVELVDNELATLYMNSKKSEVNTAVIHTIHGRLWLSFVQQCPLPPDSMVSLCRLISETTLPCCDRQFQ